MAKFAQTEIGAELDFSGEARIDIAVSEQGISSTLRRLNQVAAAFQRLDPGVALSLRGEALRLGENMESVVKGAAVIALQVAVQSTPVDTGLARAGWTVRVNQNRPGSHPTPETDKEGIRTIEEGTTVIEGTDRKEGQIYWISNSQFHITALEHGHSRQAPNGMTEQARLAAEQYVTRRRLNLRGKM
jgi:hypothetical protein